MMKIEYVNEIYPTKKKEKATKTIYNSDPNKETIAAIEEAQKIANGEISVKSYKTFDEMWSDICGT